MYEKWKYAESAASWQKAAEHVGETWVWNKTIHAQSENNSVMSFWPKFSKDSNYIFVKMCFLFDASHLI